MSCRNQVVSGLIDPDDICKVREAVCVQVEKVYDHCKEKDCIDDAVVDFKNDSGIHDLIENAFKVRTKKVEVCKVFADVEELPFKRGFYTVNIRYKFKVVIEFCIKTRGVFETVPKVGFVYFNKTVMLFGSEGKVKIFKSVFKEGEDDTGCGKFVSEQDNLPITKVEVADPLVLNTTIKKVCACPIMPCCCDDDEFEEAEEVACHPHPHPHPHPQPVEQVVVTIGLFSIIKLVRNVQLLIPAFDFCYPNKECIASTDEDPCELFDTIDFPMDQFFPPQKFDFPGAEEAEENCRC